MSRSKCGSSWPAPSQAAGWRQPPLRQCQQEWQQEEGRQQLAPCPLRWHLQRQRRATVAVRTAAAAVVVRRMRMWAVSWWGRLPRRRSPTGACRLPRSPQMRACCGRCSPLASPPRCPSSPAIRCMAAPLAFRRRLRQHCHRSQQVPSQQAAAGSGAQQVARRGWRWPATSRLGCLPRSSHRYAAGCRQCAGSWFLLGAPAVVAGAWVAFSVPHSPGHAWSACLHPVPFSCCRHRLEA